MVKLVSAKVVRNRVSSVSARGLLPHKGGGSSTQPSQEEENRGRKLSSPPIAHPELHQEKTRKRIQGWRLVLFSTSDQTQGGWGNLFCLKETKERWRLSVVCDSWLHSRLGQQLQRAHVGHFRGLPSQTTSSLDRISANFLECVC